MPSLCPPDRALAVDAARGVAILGMIGYHASWFAAEDGLVRLDFSEPGWRLYQRMVAGSFFLLVGVSVALAGQHRVRFARFGVRGLHIAGCAAIVTMTSLLLDPGRLVTFGVLHCIFVCSFLIWPLRRLGLRALPIALAALAVGALPGDSQFDAPIWQWTGLGMEHAPTFDFQPLFPWIGVAVLGVVVPAVAPGSVRAVTPRSAVPLVWLGQRALFIYMAHVPLLMALSAGVRRLGAAG